MGTSSSKPSELWTKDDVSKSLASLGPNFVKYADEVVKNGVDGGLLASLDETQIHETLDDLEINNRLRRRIILKKLNDLKKEQSNYEGRRQDLKTQQQPDSVQGADWKENETDEEIALSANDLNVFDDIITDVLNQTSPSVMYSGIHLIRNEGQLVLAGSLRKYDKTLPLPRLFLRPHEVSFCSIFVRATEKNYMEKFLPRAMWDFPTPPPNYSGYILKDEHGDRLGSICILDAAETAGPKEPYKKEALLERLAAETEQQMKEHKALLAREASLQVQIQQAKSSNGSVLKDIKQFLLGDAEIESASSATEYEVDTANDPRFQVDRAAGDEISHLPPNFYDVVDMLGMPRPPIAKDDMQSIAAVEDFNLHSITGETKIGKKIKKLVSMCCRMFDFPTGTLFFHDQAMQYGIGTYVKDKAAESLLDPFEIRTRDSDGSPFFCAGVRGPAICNFPLFLKRTFVINDVSKDKTFYIAYDFAGLGAYVGSPLVDDANRVIANLCLYDDRARPDFDSRCEVQLEQITHMILQEIENWSMWNKIEKLEKERNLLIASVSYKKMQPSQGDATIVLTDIEGSTSMWECDSKAMQAALEIHDRIMRDCIIKYNSYEIDTEGDAFFLAFHDPVDAIAFALTVQMRLYEADWQDGVLKLKEAKEEKGSFRGLRVRMGIHHGPVRCSRHEVSQRTEYTGTAWNLAESLEAMAHGGQILTTLETWNLASSLGGRMLGAYQVVDLGTHVLHNGKSWDQGVVSKSGVVQIVPESLSFDYFQARCSAQVDQEEPIPAIESTTSTLPGRQFPPPTTKRQVGPSFHDAPFVDNEATIMFLCTSEAEKQLKDFETVRPSLVRLIGELLIGNGRGYHCHSLMIAFDCEPDAIRFGFKYLQVLCVHESKSQDNDTMKLSKLVKFGCFHGQFSTMGPHKSSGRADYFGKVVNRAARVASAAAPGTIYLGRTGSRAPALVSDIQWKHAGTKPLKGVQEEIVLYECLPQP